MRATPYVFLLCAIVAAACRPDATTQSSIGEPSLARSGAGAQSGALKNAAQPLLWTGTSLRDAAPTGEVPECATVHCTRFDLTLQLSANVWKSRAGGLQVALRWTGFGNNLKLYVYRDGARIAASDGIIATAQSVLIPSAANGPYQVYVAYDPDMPAEFGFPPSERIPYEALAEVEYAPNVRPLRTLLPDLESRPQRNITFDVPPPIFFEAGIPTTSCFPSEIAEEGAQLCLRFDQVLANTGEGPLEFRFVLPADPSSTPTGPIIQRILKSDGGAVQRTGGTWEYHVVHDHYHYTGFALSRLWAVDASGRKGAAPIKARRHRSGMSANPIRTGRKVSFCIVDIEIDSWAQKGDGPRTYSAPTCLIPTAEGYLLQGMSAGWADVYDWFLPDQYIEVSGLPDGLYVLETIVDPDQTILEADESNNCGGVYVRLTGMATSQPRAQLLGPSRACGG